MLPAGWVMDKTGRSSRRSEAALSIGHEMGEGASFLARFTFSALEVPEQHASVCNFQNGHQHAQFSGAAVVGELW